MDDRHHLYEQAWTPTELVTILESQGHTVIGPAGDDGWRIRSKDGREQTISRSSAEFEAQRLLEQGLTRVKGLTCIGDNRYKVWWSPSKLSRVHIARWGIQSGYHWEVGLIISGATIIIFGATIIILAALCVAITIFSSILQNFS